MRPRENYFPLVAVGFGLTLAILASFELYILREPARIASVLASDQAAAVSAGKTLFARNCSLCHGDNGEGGIGPALNDRGFLSTTADDTIFSVVSSGVPGSQMPAWNQSHGGPLTDDDIRHVVDFVRTWEPSAPDRRATPLVGDAQQGAKIFGGICYACHGVQGQGTDRAPAINNLDHLRQFDDNWYRDTITQGRPSKGMPTWGTVLSPAQIADLLALIDAWRLAPPATPTQEVSSTPEATPAAVEVARPSNPGGAGPAVGLTGDPAAGAMLFTDNCQKCHGEEGRGGVPNPGSTDGTIPPLNPIDPTLVDKSLATFAFNLDLFIEHGSAPDGPNPQQAMPAWGDEKKLTSQQIADVIAYLIRLNPPPQVSSTPEATPAAVEVARPSNPGGAGPAVGLTGDPAAGAVLFTDECQKCHGEEGKGGVPNPGSTDGTVPPLNPIDPTLVDKNMATFAFNLDLFIEHGSTPDGSNPQQTMPAWGDEKKLTPQQIADVIAYLISLNPAP